MVEVYNEEEQVERIKAWMREYLPTVLISILVVSVAFFGWRYYQSYKFKTGAEASMRYEQMLGSFGKQDPSVTKSLANNLIKTHKNTPYANLAALLLAKMDVEKEQYSQASQQLNWVLKNADSDSMKQMARNRLARVYIADKHPQKALDLLKTNNDDSYQPVIESIRGDAYIALGKTSAAYSAYQAAIKALPKADARWPLLKMKLNEVAPIKNVQ